MSVATNGANFWAKNSAVVKNASSPNPVIAEPTKLAQPQRQSDGLFCRRASTAVKTKTDWADLDDDEDFLAGFSTMRPDAEVIRLEGVVLQKDARIDELEATVLAKDKRVQELEDALQEKNKRTSELEAHEQKQKLRLEQLEKEKEAQFLHIQELVAEVDEKDRRVQKLETELEPKATVLSNLDSLSDSLTQASTDCEETKQANSDTPTTSQQEVNTDKATEHRSDDEQTTSLSSKEEATADASTEKAPPKSEASGNGTTKSSKAENAGPTFGNSDFPVFVTKETLKIIPPAPMPKTMLFPNKMSVYGKKPVPKPVAKQARQQPPSGKDYEPTIDPARDIRHMNLEERKRYAHGPKVTVTMGETTLAELPRAVFMQCSSTAYKYFTKNPTSPNVKIPADSMDVEAAKAHLRWMSEMTYQHHVFSLTLYSDPQFDKKNMNICRAARVLGINNMYVGHFTRQLCDRLRSGQASFDLMQMMCDMAYPGNDPIFECLANRIANLFTLRGSRMPKEFADLLSSNPRLKSRVEAIEKLVLTRRKDESTSRSRGQSRGRSSRPNATGSTTVGKKVSDATR